MKILEQLVTQDDFNKISMALNQDSVVTELIKKIYNPFNLNYEEICKLEPNGILVEKDNNSESIGIYIGYITNEDKRIYIILSFIPNLTEKFDLFGYGDFSNYQEVVKWLNGSKECEYLEY